MQQLYIIIQDTCRLITHKLLDINGQVDYQTSITDCQFGQANMPKIGNHQQFLCFYKRLNKQLKIIKTLQNTNISQQTNHHTIRIIMTSHTWNIKIYPNKGNNFNSQLSKRMVFLQNSLIKKSDEVVGRNLVKGDVYISP